MLFCVTVCVDDDHVTVVAWTLLILLLVYEIVSTRLLLHIDH